jgi:hypothetical protein
MATTTMANLIENFFIGFSWVWVAENGADFSAHCFYLKLASNVFQ